MIRAAGLLLLGAASATLASAADRRPLPRAASWTVLDQLQSVLTSEPGNCLIVPADPAQARSIAIGAAAFRAPLLLGGQAARSGLSCASCHRAGHDNPAFSYPGLSAAPGTADVTSSLFSSHRGDGQFNPKSIPNLSGDKTLLKVDQDPASGQLEPFILGLIVQEFDGPKPTPSVLRGLTSYVRGLSPAACRPPARIDLTRAFLQIDAALDAAQASAGAGDGATAALLISAARSEMGLIDERYPAPQLTRSAAPMRRASVSLGSIERKMARNPAAALVEFKRWRMSGSVWRRPLHASEARSLYNPELLADWIAPRP